MTNEEFAAAVQAAKTPQELREICVRAGVENGSLTQDWTGQIAPVESVMASHQAVAQRERAAVAVNEARARVEQANRAAEMERRAAQQVFDAAAKAIPVESPTPVLRQMYRIPVMAFDPTMQCMRPDSLVVEQGVNLDNVLRQHGARLRHQDEMNL